MLHSHAFCQPCEDILHALFEKIKAGMCRRMRCVCCWGMACEARMH